ncbi:uncharacterized protein LOC9660188 [Selaginella moellendorffii]|nr:uncharacterized protein LOC9660188 [Selaginella moellendorffii]XP_024525770.1 uncharacterized protein LOC9660188 [Selaginella moellendorffii]|eukprot:XP_002964839.2 uncharacterized protein LOC9660188 [Selaginella moellendorffii]
MPGYDVRIAPVCASAVRMPLANSNGKASAAPSAERKSVVELPRHVQHVSSLSNPYVKHLVKMRESSSYREATESVLVVGSNLLQELCEFAVTNNTEAPFELEMLLVVEERDFPQELSTFSQRTVFLTASVMQKLAGLKSSESVDAIGVVKLPSSFQKLSPDESLASAGATLEKWCPNPHRLLILDGIQDPGNLGTLLRTATAFAWDGVFLLPGCCDPFNDKTLRASRAANFRMPIAAGTWPQIQAFGKANAMKFYAGIPEQVHSSRLHSKKNSPEALIEKIKSEKSLCLVLGSEGQGLSDPARRGSQHLTVPMPGKFESLNVAVVGGILMFLLMNKNI